MGIFTLLMFWFLFYWNKLCKLLHTNMKIFLLNFSGSKGRVPQRYWHHLWVCWRWHVKLVLECFGCSWTTHCYWHDFSGFSFFLLMLHFSSTALVNDLSNIQQSRTLNGLGPQSMNLDLSMTEQWSEKFLSKVTYVVAGHLLDQSGEIKNLSSLLFANPFGLYQVNFLPRHGASSNSNFAIQSLNSFILLSCSILCLFPSLSVGSLTLLKSPKIHHNPPLSEDFSCLMLSHNVLLFWISQGE